MADGTHIEWTEATWNPITGCTVTSPGCTNCYAMQLAGTRLAHIPSRAGLTKATKAGPVWTGEVRLNEEWLTQPLKWKRPRMIFVCAHGDLFHESAPDEWIDRVFAVMALAPQHTFQVLTKRSARMRAYLCRHRWHLWAKIGREIDGRRWAALPPIMGGDCTPLPNVWLGVSVENQTRADERIPDLLATPAAVRWLSCEPVLGPVDIEKWLHDSTCNDWPGTCICTEPREVRIDWIVAGGESGPGARPMHPDWARSLREQCAAAGVPFFFKQWGSWAPVSQMPEDLIDSLYHPAPERHPDATRQCKVDQCVLHADATRFNDRAMFEYGAFLQGTGAMTMFAVGKKRAGRLLDGVEHNGMPS